MANGFVVAICIASTAGGKMKTVHEVMAIAGHGLEGDRYCTGKGSYNKERIGHRQVTFMNIRFLELLNKNRTQELQFSWEDCRRNIFTRDIELNWLIDREFTIGAAKFRGVKYCDPCHRPTKISGKPDFKEAFQDCGGIVAEILEGGMITTHTEIVLPNKDY